VATTASSIRFTGQSLDAIARRDGDPAVSAIRRSAYEQFTTLPVPSPETEEWRYTDLRQFDLGAFLPVSDEPPAGNLDDVKPEVLAAAGDVGERAGLAVQHNSTVVTAHLDPRLWELGVRFDSLDRAPAGLLAGRLHHAVPTDRTKFTALHGAFRSGGTFVHVPANTRVELPIQTLTYVDRDGLAVFPHTVLVTEEGAELTFIDRYVSPELGSVFSNAVVEIYAGPNSKVTYVALQDWGPGVTHLAVQRAHVGRDAQVRSLGVAFGASLSRAEVESLLDEPGGSSEMLGLYFATGDQHFDHRSIQDHYGDRTASDLLYKGVLRGHSRTIYSGNVIIRQGAHKCDAYQTNRNVLLSEHAKADSIPNLEILSNDPVRCGHAASIGPIDDEALFYMQSRGIPYEAAQRLIVTGFFQEVLDKVTLPEVKAGLESAIRAELDREE
jgi:Fe-S cluster assembly protein SufD